MKKIGRYEIVGELGRGAMGVVYKASDPTIGRLVALKVLSLGSPAEEGVPSPKEIFMREARAAGRLTHPAIVTIHDAFEDPESTLSCIVMELVPGRTLERILQSGPALTLEQTLNMARQVAEGLEYAHRQQVIHRDLKPANILVTDDGRVKITDFGIAKITAREGAARTLGIMGTPSYMSPEQVTGGEVDARSDLFSLGIVLYLALTGQKPFVGDTAAVMFKIAYADPVLPSQLNPQLGPGHDYLVLHCLAKDRAKRYSSAREFLDDLEDVENGRPPRSQAQLPTVTLPTAEGTVILPPAAVVVPRQRMPSGRSLAARVVAGACAALVVLGVAAGVGIWKLRQRKAGSLPPATAPAPAQPLAAVPDQSGAQKTTSRVPEAALPASSMPETQSPPAEEVETRKATPVAKPRVKPSTARASALPPSRPTVQAGAATAGASADHSGAMPVTPGPATTVPGGRAVQLFCRHDLKEATLTISSGEQVVFKGSMKGKKRGGFLGIKGSFVGTFSRTITVPSGARELAVHVVSTDGSVDLSKVIPAAAPAGPSTTLLVDAGPDRLAVNWQGPAPPAP